MSDTERCHACGIDTAKAQVLARAAGSDWCMGTDGGYWYCFACLKERAA